MKKLAFGLFVLATFAGGCTTDREATEPATNSVESDLTVSGIVRIDLSFLPTDALRKFTCSKLDHAAVPMDTPGCTYTMTFTNCTFNAPINECDCTATVTTSGPNCPP